MAISYAGGIPPSSPQIIVLVAGIIIFHRFIKK
jgi:hypothetical protein